jgi:hypothetical protein
MGFELASLWQGVLVCVMLCMTAMCHMRRRIHVSYEEEDTCVMGSCVRYALISAKHP